MLLPGYVTVILGIGLFFKSVFGNTFLGSSVTSDIFSAIIFIVAGPAVGFILWQIYFHLSSFRFFERDISGKERFNAKYEFERAYSQLRLVCKDNDRSELDSLQGRYVFGVSTAVGLVIIVLYATLTVVIEYLFYPHSMKCMSAFVDADSILCGYVNRVRDILIISFILAVGMTLYVGAYYDNKRVRIPLICNLIKKYNLGFTVTCEQWKKRDNYRKGKRACKIIKNYIKNNNKDKKNKKNWELSIKKDKLEEQLVTHDFEKRSAQAMINALTECEILKLSGDSYNATLDWKEKLMKHYGISYNVRSLTQIRSEKTDFPGNDQSVIQASVTSAKKDIIGSYHVRGEIKNPGKYTLHFVKVCCHFYNTNNQPIGVTTCCYTDPNDIEPGHTSTFHIFSMKGKMSGTPVSYRLSFDWSFFCILKRNVIR
jgi:hypothetical protein